MRKKLLKFSALFSLLFIFFPGKIYAATTCKVGEIATDLGCLPADPVGFTVKFYGWGLGLITFVAIIFMMVGGYYIMMSRGNPEMVNRGRSFIFYSIAGVLLAVFGFLFIEIVTGVIKIPGFS